MPSRLLPALAALALLATSCRHAPPADPAAAALPAGTTAIAGIDLAALQRSPWSAALPPSARSLLNAVPGASSLLLAWNGRDLLTLATGDFAAAPPGFAIIGLHLAASGPAALVRASRAQLKTGRTGAPGLLGAASLATPDHAIWIVTAGDAQLPFSGNLAMLARLLRYTRYTTATVQASQSVTLDAMGDCPSPAAARELEEKLRALVSLLAAMSRRPDLQTVWNSIVIERHDHVVHTHLALSPESFSKALTLLTP